MDNLQTLIGERIAKQRKQLRISQTELAAQLGKSLRTVQKYESGEIDMSVSVLEQIANILKMPINYLMGYDSAHIKLETMGDIYAYLFELDRKQDVRFEVEFTKGPETIRKVSLVFDVHEAEGNNSLYTMLRNFDYNRESFETYKIDYDMFRDWEEKEIKSRSEYFLTDKEYEVLDNEERLRRFNEYYTKKFQEQANQGDTEQ